MGEEGAGAGAGSSCCAAIGKAKLPASRQAVKKNWQRVDMREIVVENFIVRKDVCEWKKLFFGNHFSGGE